MSQNDKLLRDKGLPVLTEVDRDTILREWQRATWDDMVQSLSSYGKYIMLRPTGFGKTYTCACACNIGETKTTIDEVDLIELNNLAKITNTNILDICNKNVIFVYVSDILRETFAEYDGADKDMNGKPREVIKSKSIVKPDSEGKSRIIYETYSMLSKHWDSEEYLTEVMDIENVGLVIFDEVQRMGAKETSKALDVAIKYLTEHSIPYIGATATVERATGDDVCEKYFTHTHPNGKVTYCWGEHIFTLSNAFESGLLIPPEYQYIEEDKALIKKARQTRKSMLDELKIEVVGAKGKDKQEKLETIQELEQAVIKNSSKIIHDTMLTLYDVDNLDAYVDKRAEELQKVEHGSIQRPAKLPDYMRFLVFTPDRESMGTYKKVKGENGEEKWFGGIVNQTSKDFKDAFGRYGYKLRSTIISSASTEEKNNVRLLSRTVTEEDIKLGKAVRNESMVIDLIFSINMLNVGYHVEELTGLVLKRWTGSNQIFYQQLGRCLSVKSDKIPVVFDFVKSIDNRNITAPMFTITKAKKQVTENADGTQNTLYTEVTTLSDEMKAELKKSSVNSLNSDGLPMDKDGNLVDPRKCNIIDAKYITVSMTSASVHDIMKRQEVYLDRQAAKDLYEKSYEIYTSTIEIDEVKKEVVSDVDYAMSLDSSLDAGIEKIYSDKLKNAVVSKNFKAYLEYLMHEEKTIYVTDEALESYLFSRNSGKNFSGIAAEVNSIIAVSGKAETFMEPSTTGAKIRILVDSKNKSKFIRNNLVNDLATNLRIKLSDIIEYTRESKTA